MRFDGGRTELGVGKRWVLLTFDVELDYVSEWMELHVSVRESVIAEEHNGRTKVVGRRLTRRNSLGSSY